MIRKLVQAAVIAATAGGLIGVSAAPVSAAAVFTGPVSPGASCPPTFDNCTYNGSPIIALYNFDDGVPSEVELNTDDFPTIDGFEFTITFTPGTDFREGTWSYNGGPGDPAIITAFLTKAATTEQTFDWVPLSGTNYTNIAWATPNAALSHIAFYDTGVIPLPAAGWLLITGITGLGFIGWRRRTA